MVRFVRFVIWLYRHSLSFWMGRTCRFEPSCSVYADEALQKHGLVQGLKLIFRRVIRCGPCGGSGYDPVPDPRLPKGQK